MARISSQKCNGYRNVDSEQFSAGEQSTLKAILCCLEILSSLSFDTSGLKVASVNCGKMRVGGSMTSFRKMSKLQKPGRS